MEEIKVGEYIRTEDGCIFKATEYWLIECYSDRVIIKKHSPNIIDLIEIGDYVNGKLIHNKFGNPKNGELMIIYGNGKHFDNKNIKTVVTKEQFANAEYRLEE